VEFALVSALVVLVALGVMQLAVTLHVRNMLLSSATEGALLAAHADRTPAEGAQRAEDLAAGVLGGGEAIATATQSSGAHGEIVTVTLTSPIPVVGIWGVGEMTATASALKEPNDD